MSAAGYGLAELLARLAAQWAPPGEMPAAEWSDRYAVLSPETAAKPGRWVTRAYQREPLNATSDPTVRRVVIKSATQLLKTSVIKNAIARAIDLDPGPIMVLQHRKEDAQEFADDHLMPMVRDTERLRGKIRLSRNGKTPRHFRGGRLLVTSAGSAMNVAGKAIRYLFCDEVDKYAGDADDEGNPISLARKRLVTFKDRAKEIDTCSPTIEGSEIDRGYELSDQREFYVPCPHCGAHQSLMKKWHRVRWNDQATTREEQALSARYHCEVCEQPWDDFQRQAAVQKGEWRAHKPFNGIAGFWISELYSLDRRLSSIVLDYLQKKDNPVDLKTFVNTSLAENWVDRGEAPEWERLAARREEYPVGIVPARGLLLTAGVDVHPDRIECEVVAWGPNRESWSVGYYLFQGDTKNLTANPGERNPWNELQALLAEVFPCEGGGELTIQRLFIDTGNQTQTVYQWVRLQGSSRVIAIKGSERGHNVGQPTPVDVTYGGRQYKHGLTMRTVNVALFKEELYHDLKGAAPTEEQLANGWRYPTGYAHFPKGPEYGDEHFKQLCAEQLVTSRDKRGRLRREWQQMRARNEALDCRIYARAAAWSLGVDTFDRRPQMWRQLEGRKRPQGTFELTVPVGTVPKPPEAASNAQAAVSRYPTVSPAARRVVRSSYLSGGVY